VIKEKEDLKVLKDPQDKEVWVELKDLLEPREIKVVKDLQDLLDQVLHFVHVIHWNYNYYMIHSCLN
jgi:hypothetical protein